MTNRLPSGVQILAALTLIGSVAIYGGTTSSAIALEPPTRLSQNATSLQGRWKLTGWSDPNNPTPSVTDSEITVNFNGDRASGFAGCNNYTTSYKTNGEKLMLAAIASTRKACPPPISDRENHFLAALGKAQTYKIDSRGELQIAYQTETGKGVLVFAPQEKQALLEAPDLAARSRLMTALFELAVMNKDDEPTARH